MYVLLVGVGVFGGLGIEGVLVYILVCLLGLGIYFVFIFLVLEYIMGIDIVSSCWSFYFGFLN